MEEERTAGETEIREKIAAFIQENFLMYQEEDETLDPETSFLEEGIIDSTGVLEIISFVEETFQIKIEDEELVPENLDSIARLARFVERKRRSAGDGGASRVA